MHFKHINVTQAIPRESPNTILNNTCVVGNKLKQTNELVDVLCPSEAYEKISWWFFDLSLPATAVPGMLDKKFDISLRFK